MNVPGLTNWFTSWRCTGFEDACVAARHAHRPLVVANGVFDLLHPGHVGLLYEARVCLPNSFVIAAVNSDESTRRLKGSCRPFMTLEHRLRVLAAVRYVDVAVGFYENTPEEMFKALSPDCLVKGNEYSQSVIAGAESCGRVVFASMNGEHTSDLASRLAFELGAAPCE